MEIIKKMHYKSKLILCYLVLVSFPLILCLILLYQSIVKPVRENAVSAIDQRLEQELSTINSKIEKIRNVSYLVSTNTVINKFFVPKFYGDRDFEQRYFSPALMAGGLQPGSILLPLFHEQSFDSGYPVSPPL